MDCKNFMINDWYMSDVPCRVEKNFGNVVWGKGEDFADDTDDPQPIPLTAEMLVSNGWSLTKEYRHKEGIYRLSKNCRAFRDMNEVNPLFWFDISHRTEIGTKCVKGFIKYVHELQQALRLCGLYDIADNFRI